jgi:rare lipoprotein A
MKKLFALLFFTFLGVTCVGAQTLTGTASFYAAKFNGRKTATGAIFSNNAMTCACNKLPLGTRVRVTNLKNGKSVELTVTDRLAANNRRVADLTQRAAKELGFYSAGLTKVKVEVLPKKKAAVTPPVVVEIAKDTVIPSTPYDLHDTAMLQRVIK